MGPRSPATGKTQTLLLLAALSCALPAACRRSGSQGGVPQPVPSAQAATPSYPVRVHTASPDGPTALPEAERKILWDIEHHGQILGKHGFGPIAQALSLGERAAL